MQTLLQLLVKQAAYRQRANPTTQYLTAHLYRAYSLQPA
jgi:hypothetical protein